MYILSGLCDHKCKILLKQAIAVHVYNPIDNNNIAAQLAEHLRLLHSAAVESLLALNARYEHT